MNDDLGPVDVPLVRVFRAGKWLAASVLFTAVTLLSGVGLAALLGRSGAESTWDRWSAVGQTFGALSTVVSGLALMAFVATFMSQVRELKMQRAELMLQGQSLERSRAELHRHAEVGIRSLHLNLLNRAIDDPQLAEVWPSLEPGLSHERDRQYLYANLIFQHHWLVLRTSGDYTEEQAESTLRYLFMSPLMRKYWQAAANARRFLVPGTEEYFFCQRADEICHEYEAVLASEKTERGNGSTPPPESVARWERLNTERLDAPTSAEAAES